MLIWTPAAFRVPRHSSLVRALVGVEDLRRERQARPGAAVAAGANARGLQSVGGLAQRPGIHRALARADLVQRLAEEHRERHRRRVKPFPVLRQLRLGQGEHLGAGEHVEKLHRATRPRPLPDPFSTLSLRDLDIAMVKGWPRGCVSGCLVTTILSTSAGLLPPSLEPLTNRRDTRCGFSKCHCPWSTVGLSGRYGAPIACGCGLSGSSRIGPATHACAARTVLAIR